MSIWEIVFKQLKKEKSLTVLFFVYHFYYGRSIKDLAKIFNMKPLQVSSRIGNAVENIRNAYKKEGEQIGEDGNLIGYPDIDH